MQYKPYAGNGKPFLYAMFTSEDRETAQPILEEIAGRGYSIWPSARFDRRRIDKAALAVLFLTPEAAADEAVNQTINYAVQKDKTVLVVHLAPTQLSPAQKLMLYTLQGILRYDSGSDEAFYEKLFGSALLKNLRVTPAQKRASRRLALLLGGAAIIAAAAVALLTLKPADTTVPEGSLMAELGYSGNMEDITSILIFGESVIEGQNEYPFTLCSSGYDLDTEQWYDTIAYGDKYGETIERYGEINDISDFAQLENLYELSIAGNRVTDISPLFQLKNLEILNITGNPVGDLSGIEGMESLKTLYIAGTQVQTLVPLDGCENLKMVFVDTEQYSDFEGDGGARAYTLVKTGPREELKWLNCGFYGGITNDWNDFVPYTMIVGTRSGNIYDDYVYALFKNGEPIRFDGQGTILWGDGSQVQEFLLNQTDFGDYDPSAEYTLVASYGDWSVTILLYHESVDNCQQIIADTVYPQ